MLGGIAVSIQLTFYGNSTPATKLQKPGKAQPQNPSYTWIHKNTLTVIHMNIYNGQEVVHLHNNLHNATIKVDGLFSRSVCETFQLMCQWKRGEGNKRLK